MKTRDEHIEFLRLNLPAIAACAWTGFQAKGRGLILVDCNQHDEAMRTVPFDFMPEQNVSKLIDPWYGTKEARMIAEYDPKIEIITGFYRSDEDRQDFDCYRLKPNPAPPIAAERA